jgi:hypothetical protein
MVVAHNVFEPEDLELAQNVLDEIWVSLPNVIRRGPRSAECRDWLARQVLAAIKTENVGRDYLKSLIIKTDMTAWA